MRLMGAVGMVALSLATACSPRPASQTQSTVSDAPAAHAISGLPVIPLTVAAKGKVHRFRVELARTDAEQSRGLMFRTEMGADEGMIFPYAPPRQVAFWMKNTVIPLDIIYIGADRRVLNVAQALPYDERPLPSAGAASGVLELNAGRAAALGIGPGDRVAW
jgi:uncharacterized protein